MGQKTKQKWKDPAWRQDPKALLAPRQSLDTNVELRDDFWRVCCQPLLREKKRSKFGDQLQSVKAATLSKNIAEFLRFVADGLNRDSDGTTTYSNPFWVKSSFGTPVVDADGKKIVKVQKSGDRTFSWMEQKCPQLLEWRHLAIEFAGQIPRSLSAHLAGLGMFFETYLGQAGQPGTPMQDLDPDVVRVPAKYLMRANRLPDTFKEVGKSESAINAVVAFLDWVLLHHFSVEDDDGDPVVSAEYKNPLSLLDWCGKSTARRTVREAMPYLWVERLRMILAQGEDFSHWKWAQQAQEHSHGGGADWFEVPESLIDKQDPDCVWRKRTTGKKGDGNYRAFFEIWSPVRWVALLAKLTTALRNFQVRVLDSGESDEWRFCLNKWAANSSPWVLNDIERRNPQLANHLHRAARVTPGKGHTKADVKGWRNGVLRRVVEHQRGGLADGTMLYANTNKSADGGKEGAAKGFELPLPMEPCPVIVGRDGKLARPHFDDKKAEYLWLLSLSRNIHFWLAKLRDWQEKYNCIERRLKWKELDGSGLLVAKSDEQYAAYLDACFLFREPSMRTANERKPSWPLSQGVLEGAWWAICKELQDRFVAEGKTQNGEFIRLVIDDMRGVNTCVYDLHAIRVSLVTSWIVEGEIDPDVVMLLTGHSRLVMLLYYNARTMRSAQDAISQGQQRIDEKKAQRELDHIRNASIDQILKDTAYNDAESIIQALGGFELSPSIRRLAGWMRMPEGFCPVGGNTLRIVDSALIAGCFNGGSSRDSKGKHGPVEGGDHNCSNCRWFITTPAFIEALQAKFNVTAFQMKLALDKARDQEKLLHELQGELYEIGKRHTDDAMQAGMLTRIEEAQKLAERHGAEYTLLATTLLNVKRQIDRVLQVQRNRDHSEGSEALVLSGGTAELEIILKQTDSELLQLHLAEASYAVFPEFDPGEAIWRRSQILDASLAKEGLPPIFLSLSKEDQVNAGNEFLHRIGRTLKPDAPGEGVLQGIRAIESGDELGHLLGLTKVGMAKLLKDSKTAVSAKVIRLVLARSSDSGPRLLERSEEVNE
ncbi:gamma-mobile-trio integrase GmtZ [Roseateles sp. PN1]|uniref:gamma-mobile-trio integrase GmtZ n=1 Tax=Roseateles sp. PN1 TaxID=3137372 RepID=UPI00313985AE